MRATFFKHIAQTSPAPVGLHITYAEGTYLYDVEGKAYLDLIGGISVAHLGHRHPQVVSAIKKQADEYLHVMVYGELIQSPQVSYAEKLAAHLPAPLSTIYFTNSGAEAVEGAIKLVRRATRKTQILAAHKSYHGSTTGALSLLGDEYWRQAFRPLMSGVKHEPYNSEAFIEAITQNTAAVFIEPIQAEAGVIAPDLAWIQAVRAKCNEVGSLLVIDEIQCGFGRTDSLWCFEQYGIVPDVLLLGKALGGGMPLGAFIASSQLMALLTEQPVLGHITTFGGHPVSCAAGLAAFDVLISFNFRESVARKGLLFQQLLVHDKIKAVRQHGLLIAIELDTAEATQKTLSQLLANGIFSDWFLFAPNCLRIAPPYIITEEEIAVACYKIKQCLNSI